MAKLHIFGSCSGTEPMPGRHHCSFALDFMDWLYWFDAGECCSYTAHLMGLDLLKVREIFISHPHMDHVGGLGNLLWTIRKLAGIRKQAPYCGGVETIIPSTASFEHILGMLADTEGNFVCSYPVTCRETKDGVIYDDGDVKVEAVHNHHLKHEEGTPWRSFSFRISFTEGNSLRRVIFSGDVKSPDDIACFLDEGCDLFLMETGHHNPLNVAQWLTEHQTKLGRLCFIHHGRHLLNEYAVMKRGLDESCPCPYVIAEDAMTLDV